MNSVYTSQKAYCLSITKTISLLCLREITALGYENGIKFINIFCRENAGRFNIQEGGMCSGYCTDGLKAVLLQ
jgi:hypothetical protein